MNFINVLTMRNTIRQKGTHPLPATLFLTFATNCYSEAALERINIEEFDRFYIASEFTLPLTRKIYISEATVSFEKNWLDEFRSSTTDKYRSQIISKYGQTLERQLTNALQADGWEVVNTPDADTVLLTPKIFKLYIEEPGSRGIKHTITRTVGVAAMELIFKTPDGQTFIKIADYEHADSNSGSAVRANEANNFRYFKKLMRDWSVKSSEYLGKIVAIAEQQAGQTKQPG